MVLKFLWLTGDVSACKLKSIRVQSHRIRDLTIKLMHGSLSAFDPGWTQGQSSYKAEFLVTTLNAFAHLENEKNIDIGSPLFQRLLVHWARNWVLALLGLLVLMSLWTALSSGQPELNKHVNEGCCLVRTCGEINRKIPSFRNLDFGCLMKSWCHLN